MVTWRYEISLLMLKARDILYIPVAYPLPGGLLGISRDGDDRMEIKVKKKISRASSKTPKKSLDPKLTPQKSHADFVALKS